MRTSRNQKAHQRLNSWASWVVRFTETSALGAKITNYHSERAGGPAGPIVPNVFRDPTIVMTERAVISMTPTVQEHIQDYYIRLETPRITKSQREYMLKKIADYLLL